MVTEIVSPWGPGIEERPPVMTLEEWVTKRREQRERKVERRMLRDMGGEETVEGLVERTAVAS